MTSGQKNALALAVLIAAAAVAFGWQSGSLRVQAGLDVGGVPDKDTPDGRAVRGQASGDVTGLPDRHPLHRRHDGHAMRDCLQQGGWAWYLDPPAEANL